MFLLLTEHTGTVLTAVKITYKLCLQQTEFKTPQQWLGLQIFLGKLLHTLFIKILRQLQLQNFYQMAPFKDMLVVLMESQQSLTLCLDKHGICQIKQA